MSLERLEIGGDAATDAWVCRELYLRFEALRLT